MSEFLCRLLLFFNSQFSNNNRVTPFQHVQPMETERRKKKKVKIEVNKIMNPAFLLGTAFNIAYWHRKYHSGTICKGVSNPQTSNALSGCEKEEMWK